MGIDIPFPQGISLKIGEPLQDRKGYPTGRLQKGFILLDHGEQMAEEAVGFGVPVLKRGLQAIFPGDVSLTWQRTGSTWEVTALFQMNLVEKISKSDHENVGSNWLYRVKDILAESIRRFPPLRGLLTGISSMLRKVFNLKTIYVAGEFSTELKVTTTLDGSTGRMVVVVEAGRLPAEVTEVVVMNEQGANFFDSYGDSGGNSLQGAEIGCWDEVSAQEAWFESSASRVAFKLRQAEGGQLFRGRELIGSRLAWAGFGYSFPASAQGIRYEMKIERLA